MLLWWTSPITLCLRRKPLKIYPLQAELIKTTCQCWVEKKSWTREQWRGRMNKLFDLTKDAVSCRGKFNKGIISLAYRILPFWLRKTAFDQEDVQFHLLLEDVVTADEVFLWTPDAEEQVPRSKVLQSLVYLVEISTEKFESFGVQFRLVGGG